MVTRTSIGYRRIPASTRASTAAATRSVRAQFRQVERNLKELIASIESATIPAVRAGLKPIFKRSQELVPIDTGKLKQSGFLVVQRNSKRKIQAEVGYARRNRPNYAVFVHENQNMSHKAPTQAKFLERAIDEELPKARGRIVSYLRSHIRGRSSSGS